MGDLCMEHSGHVSRLENLEKEYLYLMKSIESAHRRIDGIKNWVILGMGSLVLHLVLAVIGFLKQTNGVAPGS